MNDERNSRKDSGLDRSAYVIGLEDNYRGLELQEQLQAAGFYPQRIDAFDARDLPDATLDHIADQRAAEVLFRRRLTPGEIGCAVSHRIAVAAAHRATTSEWTLIFEDDARLSRHFPNLDNLVARLPTDTPVILVMWFQSDYTVCSKRDIERFGSITLARALTPPISAVGYALNSAARKVVLASKEQRIRFVADWPPDWSYRIDFYIAYPPLVRVPEDIKSTLEQRRSLEEICERPIHKIARHALAATGISFIQQRPYYGSLRDYVKHEGTRPALLKYAKFRNLRLDGDPHGPYVL
jgi:GR25 family glycosyltransferase involved in LPS biosynthesis